MKNYILFFLALGHTLIVVAQRSSKEKNKEKQFEFISFEVEGQFSSYRFSPESQKEPYYLQWSRAVIVNSKGKGMYFEITQDTSYFSIGGGIVRSTLLLDRWYFDGGVGPEFDLGRRREDKMLVVGINGYVFIRNKPQVDRAKGKFELLGNVYYSKEYNGWYSVSAIFSPVKWIGVGFFSQQEGVRMGPLLRLQLPVIRPWCAFSKKEVTIGMNLSASTIKQKTKRVR